MAIASLGLYLTSRILCLCSRSGLFVQCTRKASGSIFCPSIETGTRHCGSEVANLGDLARNLWQIMRKMRHHSSFIQLCMQMSNKIHCEFHFSYKHVQLFTRNPTTHAEKLVMFMRIGRGPDDSGIANPLNTLPKFLSFSEPCWLFVLCCCPLCCKERSQVGHRHMNVLGLWPTPLGGHQGKSCILVFVLQASPVRANLESCRRQRRDTKPRFTKHLSKMLKPREPIVTDE